MDGGEVFDVIQIYLKSEAAFEETAPPVDDTPDTWTATELPDYPVDFIINNTGLWAMSYGKTLLIRHQGGHGYRRIIHHTPMRIVFDREDNLWIAYPTELVILRGPEYSKACATIPLSRPPIAIYPGPGPRQITLQFETGFSSYTWAMPHITLSDSYTIANLNAVFPVPIDSAENVSSLKSKWSLIIAGRLYTQYRDNPRKDTDILLSGRVTKIWVDVNGNIAFRTEGGGWAIYTDHHETRIDATDVGISAKGTLIAVGPFGISKQPDEQMSKPLSTPDNIAIVPLSPRLAPPCCSRQRQYLPDLQINFSLETQSYRQTAGKTGRRSAWVFGIRLSWPMTTAVEVSCLKRREAYHKREYRRQMRASSRILSSEPVPFVPRNIQLRDVIAHRIERERRSSMVEIIQTQ